MNSGKLDSPRPWNKGSETDKEPLEWAWLTSPLLPPSPLYTPVMTLGHLHSVLQGSKVVQSIVPEDDASTGSFQTKFPEPRVSRHSNSWAP